MIFVLDKKLALREKKGERVRADRRGALCNNLTISVRFQIGEIGIKKASKVCYTKSDLKVWESYLWYL